MVDWKAFQSILMESVIVVLARKNVTISQKLGECKAAVNVAPTDIANSTAKATLILQDTMMQRPCYARKEVK